MADEVLLTPIETVDEEIKLVIDQLKRELAASYESPSPNDRLPTSDKQIERIRNLIFTGKEMTNIDEASLPVYVKELIESGLRLPLWDAGLIVDPDWIDRFNAAIEAGNQELAMRILVDKEDAPDEGTVLGSCCDIGKRNKYCELELADETETFGNNDRIKALLWYLNYIFFIEQQHYYAAYHMIRERKKRNTIFPKTSPWYFTPTLRGSWERQDVTDKYVDYFNQELYVPFLADLSGKKVTGCYLKVNNNLIDDYTIVVAEGVTGNLKITLATSALREEYLNVTDAVDFQNKVNGVSAIGSIELTEYSDSFLLPAALSTYTRDEYRFTREQVDVFSIAFYGDYATKPQWVALNMSAERRITLSGWEDDYKSWLSIQNSVEQVFLDLLVLRPLGEVVDFPILERMSPDILQAKAPTRTNDLSDDMMQRLVDIIKEDDVLTPDFLTMMDGIETYVDSIVGKQTAVPIPETEGDKVARIRYETLFGTKEGLNIEVFELPPFWSLQRVSVKKFGVADYWRDIADLNNVSNPLDEVEMFEGRRLALPRSAADKAG
jgi:hypothetical protein